MEQGRLKLTWRVSFATEKAVSLPVRRRLSRKSRRSVEGGPIQTRRRIDFFKTNLSEDISTTLI